MNSRQCFTVAVTLIGAVLLQGCSTFEAPGAALRGTDGPEFELEAIPPDRAAVYIYRPRKLAGGGLKFDVRTGDTAIVTLRNGGYYRYIVKPGPIELWAQTEVKESVTRDLEAGRVYYVRGGLDRGIFVGHPFLEFVSEDVGRREVLACKRLSPIEAPADR